MRIMTRNGKHVEYSDAIGFGKCVIDVHKGLKNKDIQIVKKSLVVSATYDPNNAGNTLQGKLDIGQWLPFAAPKMQISSNISDYIFVPVFTIPSDLPNRNSVAFPAKALREYSVDAGMLGYQTFKGKPVHYEHCFRKTAPILTRNGYEEIAKLKVGDEVLSHTGKFRRITKVFANKTSEICRLRAYGLGSSMYITDNHPIMVVDKRQLFGRIGRTPLDFGCFAENLEQEDLHPHYRPVSDVYPGDFLVVPITIGGGISADKNFAFLLGAYLAEGSFSKNKKKAKTGVLLTLGSREQEFREKIIKCCENLGYKYKIYKEGRGVCPIGIYDSTFTEACENYCGEYSHLKKLQGEIRDWDSTSLKHFLGGYISGDGSTKGARLRCVTVSRQLAYDLQNVFARLGIPASITKNPQKDKWMKSLSSEKLYRKRTSYTIGASPSHAYALNDYLVGKKVLILRDNNRETNLQVFDDYLLTPVMSKDYFESKETVYNLEVEKDHTYVAYNVIVHNCNEDPTKAYGVIADCSLRKLKGFGGGKVWKLMELLAIDRSKHSDTANQILSGDYNSYSMGAMVGRYTCSICNSNITSKQTCGHVGKPGTVDFREFAGKLSFKNVWDIHGIETSIVATPAFHVANSDTLLYF